MERGLVKVDVGECRCEPDFPHGTDWVKFAAEPGIEVGTAVYAAIRTAGDDNPRMQALMAKAYMLGIREWSFTQDGRPVRVDPAGADWPELLDRFLPWTRGGMEAADAADTLYSEPILRPFLSRTPKQSPGGRTAQSTSPTRPTSKKHPKPSKRSSPVDTDGSPSEDPAP